MFKFLYIYVDVQSFPCIRDLKGECRSSDTVGYFWFITWSFWHVSVKFSSALPFPPHLPLLERPPQLDNSLRWTVCPVCLCWCVCGVVPPSEESDEGSDDFKNFLSAPPLTVWHPASVDVVLCPLRPRRASIPQQEDTHVLWTYHYVLCPDRKCIYAQSLH